MVVYKTPDCDGCLMCCGKCLKCIKYLEENKPDDQVNDYGLGVNDGDTGYEQQEFVDVNVQRGNIFPRYIQRDMEWYVTQCLNANNYNVGFQCHHIGFRYRFPMMSIGATNITDQFLPGDIRLSGQFCCVISHTICRRT